jgi:hypothetical protein
MGSLRKEKQQEPGKNNSSFSARKVPAKMVKLLPKTKKKLLTTLIINAQCCLCLSL